MHAARAATLAAGDQLHRRVAALADLGDMPAVARVDVLGIVLHGFDDAYIATRRQIDDGLAKPWAERDPGLTQSFAVAQVSLQQRLVPLLDGLQARVAIKAPDAAAILQVARYAADLREIAGLQASVITAAIAEARPFTVAESLAAQRTEGQIDLLRGRVDAAIEYVGNPPALVEARQLAAAGYFTRGRAAIDQMLASGSIDGRYPIKLPDFIHTIAGELPSLMALRDSAANAALAEAARSRDEARSNLVLSVAILVTVVAVVVGLGVYITRGVVVPMLGLTAKIERLAAGDRDVTIDSTNRKDEIGGLTHAMRVFHDALVEIETLQGQLLQSHKMEAIGTMAGGVAHELNNLLQPILMLCEPLADSLAPDDLAARADLATIVQNAEQSRDIVKSVVTIARKTSSAVETLDIGKEIRTAGALVRGLLPDGVTLDATFAKAPCPALVNRTELIQVLSNLVVNAAQAMASQGIVRVVVEPAVISEGEAAALQILPGRYASLSVIDSGCGIEPAVRHRIFEPFFTTKPAGTGLGLSVANGIVRAWKGAMRVDSTVGRGSTFSVLMPMVSA
jgi:signal transduction histidine kinase